MTVTERGPGIDAIKRAMRKLTRTRVLVGIPSDKANRKKPDANNAAIGYRMENGEPEHNVPARPFLVPGVEKVLPKATKFMQQAAKAALDGNDAKMEERLEAAGQVCENSVRETINSNLPPPLAPSTVANRKYDRAMSGEEPHERQTELDYAHRIAQGMSPGEAQADQGIVALVNTGQLRNSVTHVLEKKSDGNA